MYKEKVLSAQSLNPSDFHRFKLSGDYGLRPVFALFAVTHSLSFKMSKETIHPALTHQHRML